MSRLLYIGDFSYGTNSSCRLEALRRVGYEVTPLDLKKALGQSLRSAFARKLHYSTGYRLIQSAVCSHLESLRRNFGAGAFCAAWVDGGELLGPRAVAFLRTIASSLVLYNNDDPTGDRDGNRWLSLRKSISHYDLCAVLRECNVSEYETLGAKRVLRVPMSYDEVMHRPLDDDEKLSARDYESDVVFIGTWMPERGPLMRRLLERGVKLGIRGNRWERSPEWKEIRHAVRGGGVLCRDYVKAIGMSKVCLGLVSKGNRDLHTRRSVEVPYAGGLLCAERTVEHEEMYRDNGEAVLWSDADECADRCLELLADPKKREVIRLAGMDRVRHMEVGNESVCRRIIETAAAGHTEKEP